MNFKNLGKYKLIKKIATGGMAELYLACSPGLEGINKFIAIKKILPQFADKQEFLDMFKNEARISVNLNHSNIASIHGFHISNGEAYIVMDYVSGKNLRQVTKHLKEKKSYLPIPVIANIMVQAAAGLSYAHNCIDDSTGQPLKLIHRDVSPQNIMLGYDGSVKVIDFGIAKRDDIELTRAGTLKGKFSYMSPEQSRGDALDQQTDIFCVGIILWELLTKQRLFTGPNEMSILKKIQASNPIESPEKYINIQAQDKGLVEITMKALEKSKAKRYKTMSCLEKDLRIFLNKSYPDFLQQDYVDFLKKLYKTEIIKERKSLTEYSQFLAGIHDSYDKTQVSVGVATDFDNDSDEELKIIPTDALTSTKKKTDITIKDQTKPNAENAASNLKLSVSKEKSISSSEEEFFSNTGIKNDEQDTPDLDSNMLWRGRF